MHHEQKDEVAGWTLQAHNETRVTNIILLQKSRQNIHRLT